MRVFIGLKEVGNIAHTYAKAFRTLGHETFTVVWRKNPFYLRNDYDVVIDDLARRWALEEQPFKRFLSVIPVWLRKLIIAVREFLHALFTCDLFIYLWGTSFLPKYWDYPIVKIFGKKIVSVFLGTDTRYWCAYEQEVRSMGLEAEVEPYLLFLRDAAFGYVNRVPLCIKPYVDYLGDRPDDFFPTKMITVEAAEQYADLILSQPSMAQLQSRPYMRINIPLDLSKYKFNVQSRRVPIVVHAPSSRGTKGTKYVLEAVQELRCRDVRFEFRLIENMQNTELMRVLEESDIVVDHLFGDTVGTLALESMATGKTVLSRYLREYSRIPDGCPVVNVTAANLTDRLRDVILDRELRFRLAHEGRRYVENHHNHLQIAQQILGWLQPGGITEHDFHPVFFKKSLRIPVEVLQRERKQLWNQESELRAAFLSSLKRKLPSALRLTD